MKLMNELTHVSITYTCTPSPSENYIKSKINNSEFHGDSS